MYSELQIQLTTDLNDIKLAQICSDNNTNMDEKCVFSTKKFAFIPNLKTILHLSLIHI